MLPVKHRVFAALLDAFPGLGMVVDANGAILAWNRAAEERFSRKLAPGETSIHRVLTHVTESYWKKIFARLGAEKRTIRFERSSGGQVYYHHIHPVLDQIGEITCIILSIQDITAYRFAENALADSEQKYRELVENISDTIYALNEDGTIIYVNPAVTGFLGVTQQEAVGRTLQDFLHPADALLVRDDPEGFLGGDSPRVEYRFVHKDGSLRWGRVANHPVLFREKVIGYQGVISDISQAKSSNVRLLKAVQDNILDNLADSFAAEIGVPLRRARESLLASIPADILARGPLRGLLHDLESVSLYLKNLDAFMTRRADEVTVLDVNALVKNGLVLMKHRFERNGIEVDSRLAPGLEPVSADSFALVQALLNIFDLSIRMPAVPEKRHCLSVATGMEKDKVIVDIRDCLAAVPEDCDGRLEDGSPAWSRRTGEGIGLAIARQILENQSGGLEVVTRREETGLHLRLILPAVLESL